MDPNANLKEQLELADALLRPTPEQRDNFIADAERLAELVVALDEWVRGGGPLPEVWFHY